jgi:vacuolar protein sorting-associated protein 3
MDERLDTGSYILRNLIQDVALSADGQDENIRITCVELWGTMIYLPVPYYILTPAF